MARREFSKNPEAKMTLTNKLRAIYNFSKMLITPAPDMIAYEKSVDIPRFMNDMVFVEGNSNWQKTHK
jgi:hypothetical protein